MKALIERLRKSSYVRNVFTMSMGTAMAQFIPIAVAPILTRLYSPDQFGVFALYLGLIMVTDIAATGRYELAIPIPTKAIESFSVMALSLFIALILSVLSMGVVFTFGHTINSLLGIDSENPFIYLVPLGVLTAAIFQSISYWTIFRCKFKQLATGKIAWAAGISGSQLVFAPFETAGGLMLGQVAGQVAGVATLFFASVRRDLGLLQTLSVRILLQSAKRFKKFPGFSLPADLINNLAIQIPLILLGYFFGPTVVGLVALTQRVLWAPIALLGVSVQDVF